MYLTLGAPHRVTRLASSRIFFPIEIWYYDGAPALRLNYQLQFVFFQRNGAGDYKLYSPTLDTIRALLNPRASTRGMFPVNDIITESDIRGKLNPPPAEEEVIEAALGATFLPGVYALEATAGGVTRSAKVEVGSGAEHPLVISYNANLAPDREWSAIGRQWLVRGNMAEARKCFERAQSIRPSDQNAIDLACIAALAGDLDSPRQALREILARDPSQFEALTLMGYIEARLEDYAVR